MHRCPKAHIPVPKIDHFIRIVVVHFRPALPLSTLICRTGLSASTPADHKHRFDGSELARPASGMGSNQEAYIYRTTQQGTDAVRWSLATSIWSP
jgi:hypothetical protein